MTFQSSSQYFSSQSTTKNIREINMRNSNLVLAATLIAGTFVGASTAFAQAGALPSSGGSYNNEEAGVTDYNASNKGFHRSPAGINPSMGATTSNTTSATNGTHPGTNAGTRPDTMRNSTSTTTGTSTNTGVNVTGPGSTTAGVNGSVGAGTQGGAGVSGVRQ
jgi:hypothetical protein